MRSALFALGFLFCRNVSAQPATFDITYFGFSAEAENAFNYAADIWSGHLMSDVPIKVNAKMVFLLPGQLGITFPNGELNFPGAPLEDVWYASCLANAISGEELNPGEADIDVFVNTNASWYFGTDGNPGPDEYDFVSTALHELCHGLGFLSLSNVIDTNGSFGLIYAESFSPLVTSFAWPDLDTLPGAFDEYLRNGDNAFLLTMENPSVALEGEMTGNNIFFESPAVLDINDGNAGRIYAPSEFTLGSSMSHWNEGSYPVGNENELMTPFAADGHANHSPGPLTLAALDDIGWEVDYDTATGIIAETQNTISVFPNPASDEIFIVNENVPIAEVQLVSLSGAMVFRGTATTRISLEDYPAGIYVLTLFAESGDAQRFMIQVAR